MTRKRFENRLNKDNVKFNTLNPVWDNEKQDAFNVFEMIDMLNHLHEENNELRLMLNSCSDQRDEFHRGARENANRVGKLKQENEQLKTQLSKINQLIDNKIDEFKNGDYGDLPCNTIHMFLDLKEEIGDVE